MSPLKNEPAESPETPAAVAYIAGVFPNASETFVYREVNELRRRGWAVHVCALHDPTEQQALGVAELRDGVLGLYRAPATAAGRSLLEMATHPIRTACTMALAAGDALTGRARMLERPKFLAQAFMSLGLARQLRQRRTGHIHSHFAHAPTTIGMYAAAQLKVPFSFTGHANDLFQRRTLLETKLKRARFVACISQWHRQLYQSLYADNAQRYRVIRCGVETSQWTPCYNPLPPSEPLRIMTVCRLVQKKGVDLLIRALHEFGRTTQQPWTLTIIGDGPERATLENLARDLSCSAAVRFMGSQKNEAVRTQLANADLFALLCRVDRAGDQDGIPVALMEAMACGIPVLTGDIAPIRELVADGLSGFCVNAEDTSAAAARIGWIAEHPAETATIAAGGRRRVQEEFSLSANVDRLEAEFRAARAPKQAPIKPDFPVAEAL